MEIDGYGALGPHYMLIQADDRRVRGCWRLMPTEGPNMANITAAMVKELRETTGVGMMDCKAALTENDGDMEKAIDWLRKKGLSKAAKKAGKEGVKKSAKKAAKKVTKKRAKR